MGSISFLLPNPVPAAAQATLRQAHFAAGEDQCPLPTTVEIRDNLLIATCTQAESRYLVVPWPVGPFGTLLTTTSTLLERGEPYRLLLELARGKLNQVRTQTAEWQGIGLRTPAEFDEALGSATRQFVRALFGPLPAEADAAAARVLEQSFVLGDALVREFVEQMFDTRHFEDGRLDTRLAARLTAAPTAEVTAEFGRSFNAAQVAFRWRDIEPEEARYDWSDPDRAVAAAKAAELPITGGPVIDLAPGMVPPWAAGWEGDLPTLAAFMCDFLETAIGRYKGDVRRWVVCAGFNHADALALDDDQRMRLVLRLFEAAAQIDPDLELVLGIAQPWGDYLADEAHTISPLTFADDLMRTGMRVSAIELEIRSGIVPRGSLPRDLLEMTRILDQFGVLGLPLEVVLSLPSSAQSDPGAAEHRQSVWAPGWRSGPSPEGQAEWGASFAALALCHPNVRSVTWDSWSDAAPHLTPSGGLLDPAGRAKPLLTRLRTLRSAHLR